MRWTTHAPLIVLAVCVAAALVLLAPVLSAARWLIPAGETRWIKAADDLRPRRPEIGEAVRRGSDWNPPGAQGRRQYWIEFDRRLAPRGMMGVLAAPAGESTRIYFNGRQISSAHQTEEFRAHLTGGLGAETGPNDLRAGPNRVEVVASAGAWPRAIFLGPVEPVRAAERRLVAIQAWSVPAAALLGAAGAMVGFLLVFADPRRTWLLHPSLVSLLMAGQAGATWLAPPGTGFFPWLWATLLMQGLAALVLLLGAGVSGGGRKRAATLAFRLAAGASLAVAVTPLLHAFSEAAALLVGQWGAGLAVIIGAGTALWLNLVGRGVRGILNPGQRSVAALAALSLISGAAASFEPLGVWGLFGGQAIAAVAAVAALAAFFAWCLWRGFLEVEQLVRRGLGLGRIVRDQQAQLAAQQVALDRESARRAVLEERERISRDIHDGVGGALTSLLLQARTGDLEGAALQQGLERALGELRLMIDALDHAPDTLDGAFPVLQTRLAPAFAAGGVALEWRCDDLGGTTLRDPETLLQVFRILQEACTNVLRHAGALVARVTIRLDRNRSMLEVSVEDDGRGRPAPGSAAPGGNGLRNMTERAMRIGAELEAGPAEQGGWRVRLTVPCRQAIAAGA